MDTEKVYFTDPISGEVLTTNDVLTLIDAIPVAGGYMDNDDHVQRKLSLHTNYTDWISVDLAVKVARIRRLRKRERQEAAIQACERDARLAAEHKKEIV